MPYLITVEGATPKRVYKLTDKNIIIGRAPECFISLADTSASRHHTEIFKVGELYYIRDLGSRNKTYLNKRPVEEEVLKDGDEIIIGKTAFIFKETIPEEQPQAPVTFQEHDEETDVRRALTVKLADYETDKRDTAKLKEVVSKITDFTCKSFTLLRTEEDLGSLITKIVNEVTDAIDAAQGYYFFIDKSGDIKIGVSAVKTGQKNVSKTIIRAALKEESSLLIEDARTDERFSLSESVIYKGIGSVICVPVIVQNKIAGVLYFSSKQSKIFKSIEFEMAMVASLAIGNAILNSKMLEHTKKELTGLIRSLVTTLEIIDPKTQGHSARVAEYSTAIATEMNLSPSEISGIRASAFLHDIGKIVVFKEHGKISDETIKEQHVYAGEKIVSQIEGGEALLPGIKYHHEKADGTGYPYKVKNEQTPLMARIIIVANTFDHLMSWRGVDRMPPPVSSALRSIAESAEKGEYDKDVVKALLICYRKNKLPHFE